MQRFRSAKTLQKFSSVHAQVHNHFNQERHLVAREIYKQRRSAAPKSATKPTLVHIKVTLNGIRPAIWRRLLAPVCLLWATYTS